MVQSSSLNVNGNSSGTDNPSFTQDEKRQKAQAILGAEAGGSIVNADDELLKSLGYAPELVRHMDYLTAFGQSYGAMGIAPAVAESIIFSLSNAGAPGMVWTYFVGCITLVPVALSLGELGSSMPTAGGLYYWVSRLTPERYRAFMCWVAGYMNVLGYISIYASTIYGASLILGGIASIGSDGNWSATQNMNFGMYVATIFLTFAMTTVSSLVLSRLNKAYIYFQTIMVVVTIIALAAGTPAELKNTSSFVFRDFTNTGYWPNDGWAFMLCFLTPVWVVSGFESSATIAEEASNAAKAVPFAMISALVVALFTGWALIITIAFCMGTDVLSIIVSPQPMVAIIFNSLGKNGSIALLTFLWLASVCNCSMLMVAASRETFAFARDHGLPGSSFVRILTKSKIPARAIGFVAFISILEGLLMLVNTIAINSIFNLAIMGLYFAYCMPLISRLIWKRFTPGVWYMGDRLSYISAWYSVLWMTFIFILLIFPSYPNPNAQQFNYAIVVLGIVLIFCLIYYHLPFIGGKTFFTGPVRTVDELIGKNPEPDARLEKSILADKKELEAQQTVGESTPSSGVGELGSHETTSELHEKN